MRPPCPAIHPPKGPVSYPLKHIDQIDIFAPGNASVNPGEASIQAATVVSDKEVVRSSPMSLEVICSLFCTSVLSLQAEVFFNRGYLDTHIFNFTFELIQ